MNKAAYMDFKLDDAIANLDPWSIVRRMNKSNYAVSPQRRLYNSKRMLKYRIAPKSFATS